MKTWNDMNLPCQLGIGTWAWGDKQVWGYGKGYSDYDLKEAFELSVSSGITFFDTAELYGFGKSESLIGRFIREQKAAVIIATKFMPVPWRLRRHDLITALEHSLSRLGLKSVDLYQIHWPLHLRSWNTWMDGLAEAVEQGLTRAVGVSNYNVDQMKRAYDRLASHGIPLLSNQVEFSLLHRSPETNGLLKTCNELGIKLIAYSPLAMGVLTGKYTSAHKLTRYRGIRFNRFLPRIEELTNLMKEIGQGHGGKSPSQVALNWTICKGTFPIPGAKNANQAKENAGAQGWNLTNDEITTIEQAADRIQKR
jgi:aryl-alcohol dehydrogenase-like predicted oxidoreductase